MQHAGAEVNTAASQQEGSGFKLLADRDLYCAVCSSYVCVGFLWVLWFCPTVQRHEHAVNWLL